MIPISFANCKPAKQWIQSLLPSGAYLGLAPAASLSQLNTTSLLPQIIEKGIIDSQLWSLVLLNGQDGLFSLGGTPLASIRKVEKETQDLLSSQNEKVEGHEELKREEHLEDRASIYDSDVARETDHGWKWMPVQGIEGFWQIMMHGVWFDGVKNIFNQPAILDVRPPPLPPRPSSLLLSYQSAYSKTAKHTLHPRSSPCSPNPLFQHSS